MYTVSNSIYQLQGCK